MIKFTRDPLQNEVYKGTSVVTDLVLPLVFLENKAMKFTTGTRAFYWTIAGRSLAGYMAKIDGSVWTHWLEGWWIVPLEAEPKADKIIDMVLGFEKDPWRTADESEKNLEKEIAGFYEAAT